jgi:hypothetical protein
MFVTSRGKAQLASFVDDPVNDIIEIESPEMDNYMPQLIDRLRYGKFPNNDVRKNYNKLKSFYFLIVKSILIFSACSNPACNVSIFGARCLLWTGFERMDAS